MVIEFEKTLEDCLKEMFRRVGLKYPNPEFTKQDKWYQMKNWTEEQERKFKIWMKKLLKKRYPQMTKRDLDLETGLFLLDFGWSHPDAVVKQDTLKFGEKKNQSAKG